MIASKSRQKSWMHFQKVVLTVLSALMCLPLWAQPRTTGEDNSSQYAPVASGVMRVLFRQDARGAVTVSTREQEMLARYAAEHRLRLQWIPVAASWNLIPQLVAGEGDIIVGEGPDLTAGMASQARFTSSWVNARRMQVVVRTGTTRIRALDDLGDRQVALKQSSLAWPVMEQLAGLYPAMDLIAIPEEMPDETVMARVATGQYDITIADADFLAGYLHHHPELTAAYDIGERGVKAWAVHDDAVALQRSLDQFLFRTQLEWSLAHHAGASGRGDGQYRFAVFSPPQKPLSPYDDLVRKYADQYGFDWRLIVAQMYQESKFKPGAVSYAGAAGLMQVLPDTAAVIGADNLSDPESNIHAGLKYLDILRSQFEPELLLEERIWFSLASYNAGPGRVMRARRLAARMGLDPNRWFGNVEQAMLELGKPVEKDGELVRNCRCGQTVVYVKKIRSLYHDYVRRTRSGQVAAWMVPVEELDI